MSETKGGLPIRAFVDGAAWEAWLAAQPPDATGLSARDRQARQCAVHADQGG